MLDRLSSQQCKVLTLKGADHLVFIEVGRVIFSEKSVLFFDRMLQERSFVIIQGRFQKWQQCRDTFSSPVTQPEYLFSKLSSMLQSVY